jgi:hypothetical protein
MSQWMLHSSLLYLLQGLSFSFGQWLHERLFDLHSQLLHLIYCLDLCLILSAAQTVDKSNLISIFHNEVWLLFQPPLIAVSAIAVVSTSSVPYSSAFIPSPTINSSYHDKAKRHLCYGGLYGRIRL